MSTTKFGTRYKFGDVILTYVQFVDKHSVKRRPAAVLFEKYGNIVVAGISSNVKMEGIPLYLEDGVKTRSVIKLNSIFTVIDRFVEKQLFSLSQEKKNELSLELVRKLTNF